MAGPIVKDLIAQLSVMPSDAEVVLVWDGDPRTQPECVWLARNGEVCLGAWAEEAYSDSARPEGSPSFAAGGSYHIGEVLGVPRPDWMDED